jgi:hypothetical protein
MRRGRCWWASHYDTKVRAPSAGSQRAAAMGSVVTWNRGMLTPRYVVAFITNYATAANATAPLASAVGCDEGVAIVLERRGQQKSEDNESRPLGQQWLAAPSSRSTFRT